MNERYACRRCLAREAYVSNGLCLYCDVLTGARQAEANIMARPTSIAVEAIKPINITNRKIRF